MKNTAITKATLGRLPSYLRYVEAHEGEDTISAVAMARDLGLGEVLVRKDLRHVCSEGRPKIGYPTKALRFDLEAVLGKDKPDPAVLVGVGALGLALLRYKGFEGYGLRLAAGFDSDEEKALTLQSEYPVFPMREFETFCREFEIKIGIITVPEASAQKVCDEMVESGIRAIWNFAPCELTAPDGVAIKNENLALTAAHLRLLIN